MVDLKGKVVIITGASSGIGAAAGRLFAREGCKVVLAARRFYRLEELAREIRGEQGQALPVKVDVTRLDQIHHLVEQTVKAYGRIDILFNNAGFGRFDWLESLDVVHDIQSQIAVDLLGAIWTAQAVLPQMYRQHSGHIINMCSIAGLAAPPLYSVYSAAKFGLRGFSEALRGETTPFGVKVSVVYPGSAATEFQLHMGGNKAKQRFRTPERLRLSAEAVALSVVGLARRPRRALVTPWWMVFSSFANSHFSLLSDMVQSRAFAPYHEDPKANL